LQLSTTVGIPKTIDLVIEGIRRQCRIVFPHFVDMVVPPRGLGKRLDAMYEFRTQYGIEPQRGHGRHDANGRVIRWCFADEEIAKSFAIVFGACE
jgi:hypothetical protein